MPSIAGNTAYNAVLAWVPPRTFCLKGAGRAQLPTWIFLDGNTTWSGRRDGQCRLLQQDPPRSQGQRQRVLIISGMLVQSQGHSSTWGKGRELRRARGKGNGRQSNTKRYTRGGILKTNKKRVDWLTLKHSQPPTACLYIKKNIPLPTKPTN